MELKKCPFCGGEVSMIYNSFDKAFKVYHKNGSDSEGCLIIEPISIGNLENMSFSEAEDAWNRRV